MDWWIDSTHPRLRPFSHGRKAGEVTDDSSQMIELCKAFLEAGTDRLTVKHVVDALLRWAEDPEMFTRFAGPTTRQAIERLRAGEDPVSVGRSGITSSVGTSNGCAMKIAPAGLIHPGHLEDAVEDACTVCLPTHAPQISMSAASAVAAGIAQALTPGANVYSVVQACLFGARLGEGRGRELGRTTPGPSVEARMEIAVELGLKAKNIEDACRLIGSYVGSGCTQRKYQLRLDCLLQLKAILPRQWWVPLVSEMIRHHRNHSWFSGRCLGRIDQIPKSLYDQLEELNHLGLEGLAEQLCDLALRLHPEINR